MSLKYIGPSRPGKKNAVILLHGAGANRHDLAPLSQFLDGEGNYDWYFPEAPLVLNPIFNMHIWFPVDEVIGLLADPNTDSNDVADYIPPLMESARKSLDEFIENLLPSYDRIVIGGFSQGAMMSADYYLRNCQEKVEALLLFSGSSIDHKTWLKNMASVPKIPVFQSHGGQDTVLPFRFGEILHEFLQKNGFQVEFHQFSGGHELPENVLYSAQSFLKKHLG